MIKIGQCDKIVIKTITKWDEDGIIWMNKMTDFWANGPSNIGIENRDIKNCKKTVNMCLIQDVGIVRNLNV